MLVESRCGSTAGQVVNLSPLAARAMLADGRAVPYGTPSEVAAAVAPTPSRRDAAPVKGRRS